MNTPTALDHRRLRAASAGRSPRAEPARLAARRRRPGRRPAGRRRRRSPPARPGHRRAGRRRRPRPPRGAGRRRPARGSTCWSTTPATLGPEPPAPGWPTSRRRSSSRSCASTPSPRWRSSSCCCPALRRAARPGRERQLGRRRRGLRGLGRLRRQQGGARPPRRGARRRGPGAAGLRRRPRRHAHRDAPGRVPGRGHQRPARAREPSSRRCSRWSTATCPAAATAPPTWLPAGRPVTATSPSRADAEATAPPEARGLARDEVRLLAARPDGSTTRRLPRPPRSARAG